MKKSFAGLVAVAAIAGTLAASTTDASAQWRGRGWGWRGPGWGPGVAAGVIGGAIVAGAIIASMPPGYVVYPGYAQPIYAPGCYWASQPTYDPAGHVVGYMGRPVQVCPGYVPPPAPPPGYVGAPPPVGPAIAGPGPQPGSDPTAYCMQRFKSYDPRTGTYLGNDGQRHPCPRVN